VNSLSLKRPPDAVLPYEEADSATTLSADWARYFRPWTTKASQKVQG